MAVVFDISRLLMRAGFDTPTGIDRFELSYAKWALGRFDRDVHFVAHGPFGHRSVAFDSARELIAYIIQKWNSKDATDEAAAISSLAHRIERGSDHGPIVGDRGSRPVAALRKSLRVLQSLPALCWSPSTVRPASLFIHVSHSQIDKASRYEWLTRRSCLPLFYLHDLIPLLRPEFCRAGEASRHRNRIQTILRLHRLIICNSQTTARTLDEMAAQQGLAQPFSAVLPPGLEDAFLNFDPATRLRTRQPYYVCLGTIEPRKNHRLLLDVWRQLVERHGRQAPRLVIAGRRGWDNAHVFSSLDNHSAFQGTVIEAPGLTDRTIARLLAGAAGLLAPSHIEGYGMPLAEALALGTPVIASNIRAHREVSRGNAVLLDTLDGIGWLSAVEAHARRHQRVDSGEQKHWTWNAHFNALNRLLMSANIAQSPVLPPAADRLNSRSRQGVQWQTTRC